MKRHSTEHRSSWVIAAQIDKLKKNLEEGRGNPYALKNLISKGEKELAAALSRERGEGVDEFINK